MPSMSDSHISCQAQPNINRQANTFLNMFAYTAIKFKRLDTCVIENDKT